MASKDNNLDSGELNLYPFYIKLIRHKYIVLAFIIFFIFIASIYLRFANYTYTISLEVIPTEQNSNSEFGSNTGILSSLAGFSINQESTHFNNYIKIITNKRILARELAKDNVFMATIFKNQWDDNLKKWQKPKSSFSEKIINVIKQALGLQYIQKVYQVLSQLSVI